MIREVLNIHLLRFLLCIAYNSICFKTTHTTHRDFVSLQAKRQKQATDCNLAGYVCVKTGMDVVLKDYFPRRCVNGSA